MSIVEMVGTTLAGASFVVSMFALSLSVHSFFRLKRLRKKAVYELDALALENERLKRERDALLDYLTKSTCAPCDICKHDVDGSGVMGCQRIRDLHGVDCFEWRGLCAENTAEGKEE